MQSSRPPRQVVPTYSVMQPRRSSLQRWRLGVLALGVAVTPAAWEAAEARIGTGVAAAGLASATRQAALRVSSQVRQFDELPTLVALQPGLEAVVSAEGETGVRLVVRDGDARSCAVEGQRDASAGVRWGRPRC